MSDLAENDRLRSHYPALSEALWRAASQQVRNMASLGGNLLQRTRCAYFRGGEPFPCNKREPGSGCAAIKGIDRGHALFGGSRACIATYPGDWLSHPLCYLSARSPASGCTRRRAVAGNLDDHEVANDYAGLLNQQNGDPAIFARRRAAAYQAYYEFMPLRRVSRPHNAAMRLYRQLDWGQLARFQILDDRQYRSSRACHPPELLTEHREGPSLVAACPELTDPHRTLLGHAQETWLQSSLARSPARWNVLAQQTQMTPYPRRDPTEPDSARRMETVDTWDGYAATRNRVMASWQRHRTSNPLVIGGDIHAFVASELRHNGRAVAPCFVGGSITTFAGDRLLQANTTENDAYSFANNEVRGYGRVDLTRRGAEITFRAIADPDDPATRAYDLASFHVSAGSPIISG
jgi:alkaline phosphatase D